MATSRPLRADAQRNRDAILTAARETFDTEGVLASLDGIALRAGVGWKLRIWHDLPYCLAAAHHDTGSPMKPAADPLLVKTGELLDAARPGSGITADEVYELVLALSWAVDRFRDDEPAARRRVTMATAGILP
jgi:hypothetical protein